LSAEAQAIAGKQDLAAQRAAFQRLSDNVTILARKGPREQPVFVAYCPMKKAYWLTEVAEIKNPYYGNSMLTCGNLSDTLR
jgi:hypothetical protein